MLNLAAKLAQKTVSADKVRYFDGQYDLDLTYITDRIIAMSFPAAGVESAYRNKIDNVANLFKEKHADHFIIYNLSEREYDYSKFDDQVLDWCGFPDHHPPPLPKMFQIVKSMHSWLQADPLNVVGVHCLAGKGRTGTVIAAFFLFEGLFSNAYDALNYFAIKRSNNNWGVTNPSQLRYVQYVATILSGNVKPSFQPLQLNYIHVNYAPSFSTSLETYALGRQGCSPYITIYNVTTGKKLIFSTEKQNEEDLKSYPAGQAITFQIECPVSGDILVEMHHITPLYRTENMLRFEFHAGMVEGSILHLSRADLDQACDDKRFPPGFFVDVGFHKLPWQEVTEDKWWEEQVQGDGSLCCFDPAQVERIKQATGGKFEKSGYLTKRGGKVKSMKRRWFVLKDPTLCYYRSPKDTVPAGVIVLDHITSLVSHEGESSTEKSSMNFPPHSFEVITKKRAYLVSAETQQELMDWVEAIELLRIQSNKIKLSSSQEELEKEAKEDKVDLPDMKDLPKALKEEEEEEDDFEIVDG